MIVANERTKELTNEEKVQLIRQGKYDINVFIKENEKIVWRVLSKYKQGKILCPEDEADLFSMGLGGLYRAVCDFDETRGVKFSTVAWSYILTELQRHYRDIQPHNFHGKTALSLSFNEYDFIEGDIFLLEKYQIDLNEIDLTQRQKDWFIAYLEHRNFSKVAKQFGVSKQAVRENIRQTQAKLRAKYQ